MDDCATDPPRGVLDAAGTAGERRFRSLFDVPGVATWGLDPDGLLVAMNDAGHDLLGPGPEDRRWHLLELIAEADRPPVAAAFQRLRDGEADGLSITFTLAEHVGGRRMATSAGAVRAPDGRLEAVVGVAVDVSEQQLFLHRAEVLVEHTADLITVVDPTGRIAYQSRRGEDVMGAGADPGTDMLAKVHPDDLPRARRAFAELRGRPGAVVDIEVRALHADGSWRWVEARAVNRVDEAAIQGYVVTSRDITERKLAAQRLHQAAHHDELTGLANRRQLDVHLAGLRDAVGPAATTALLLADLDHFRLINDARGHATGDRILEAVGDRIRQAIPADALAARFSGDTFAVVATLTDAAAAQALAERLRRAVADPIALDPDPLRVTVSIGVALASTPQDLDLLLQRADAARFDAKAQGRNRVGTAVRHAPHEAADRLALQAELRDAVRSGQIAVHYQPIVRTVDGRIHGYEALARWAHPVRGQISPARFIELAEQSDLVLELGASVLHTAVRDLAHLPSHGDPPIVSVNVSARELIDGDLVATVGEVLGEYAVDPSRLCLELTETAIAMDPREAGATVQRLQRMGVQIAIDDFGTGWSSFGQLKRLRADLLKIDRSFIDGLGRDQDDTEIVRAIIGVARALRIAVVAEGVEHPTQVAALADLGCDLLQGYYHSAAVTLDRTVDVAARLALHATEPMASSAVQPTGAALALQVLDHEVRNPLSVITVCADMLHEATLTEGDRTAVDAIRRASAAIAATLDSLGAAARPDSLGALSRFADVDLGRLVVDVVEEFRPLLDRKRVLLHGTVARATVLGDVQALRRILFNLLTNANKYAPGDTEIIVDVGVQAGRALAAVRDSGPGIPLAHVDRIFERHHRATDQAKGFGLGLHLAREAARHHGGDLVYRPGPDGGAAFVLDLPTTHTTAAPSPFTHAVHIATDDAAFDDLVADHLRDGLSHGEVAVLIARPERRTAVEGRLADVVDVADEQRFLALDAEQLLQDLLIHGRVDEQVTRQVIGQLISRAGAHDRRLRVYGEMVDVLAARGQIVEAVALERVWEALGHELGFSLMAGYCGRVPVSEPET